MNRFEFHLQRFADVILTAGNDNYKQEEFHSDILIYAGEGNDSINNSTHKTMIYGEIYSIFFSDIIAAMRPVSGFPALLAER